MGGYVAGQYSDVQFYHENTEHGQDIQKEIYLIEST